MSIRHNNLFSNISTIWTRLCRKFFWPQLTYRTNCPVAEEWKEAVYRSCFSSRRHLPITWTLTRLPGALWGIKYPSIYCELDKMEDHDNEKPSSNDSDTEKKCSFLHSNKAKPAKNLSSEATCARVETVLQQQNIELCEYRRQQHKRWKSSIIREKEVSEQDSDQSSTSAENESQSAKKGAKYMYAQQKRLKKRRRQPSLNDNVETKKSMYAQRSETEVNVDGHHSFKPVIIDLDPETPSPYVASTSEDIIEVQDMELASTESEEEDIVLLSSAQEVAGTPSMERVRRQDDDDVLYMGTVFDLTGSPPQPQGPGDGHPEAAVGQLASGIDHTPAEDTYPASSSEELTPSVAAFMRAAVLCNSFGPGRQSALNSEMPPLLASGSLQRLVPMPDTGFTFSEHAFQTSNTFDLPQCRSPERVEKTDNSERFTILRQRPWKNFANEVPSSEGNDVIFTVASYNVLSQDLLENNNHLYYGISKRYLKWAYRSRNLLDEIRGYEPDILCLQEVNHDHYHDFYYPKLSSLGYDGCYKKRTGMMQDGCATFYKKSKFDLDAVQRVEYLRPAADVLDRDNVALLVRLRPRLPATSAAAATVTSTSNAAQIVVANTHLLFNPKRGDVKLAQVAVLLAEIDRMAYIGGQEGHPAQPQYHPTIVTGDFNADPRGALYNFLINGSVHYHGQRISSFSGQEEGRYSNNYRKFDRRLLPKQLGITDCCQYLEDIMERWRQWNGMASPDQPAEQQPPEVDTVLGELLRQDGGSMRTLLSLTSVYDHQRVSGPHGKREREVTTHHGKACCTVDYILYTKPTSHSHTDDVVENEGCTQLSTSCSSQSQLKLVKRLELLTDRQMRKCGHLPNKHVSSDHTILMAGFQLTI